MASKEAYALRREVERIILTNGGIIFGGHVRDIVLRETSERDVVSRDIDCYVSDHALDNIYQDLGHANICVRKVFERTDAKDYLPLIHVPDGILGHVRIVVSSVDKRKCADLRDVVKDNLAVSVHGMVDKRLDQLLEAMADDITISFSVDIMVTHCYAFNKLHPPFGNIDFECNALLLTSTGIQLSPQLYPDAAMSELTRIYKLEAILEDIKVMRAVYADVGALSTHRVQKMLAKGWLIDTKHVIRVEDDASEQRCIICHEDMEAFQHHYKLGCCNARYHRDCLLLALGDGSGNTEYSMKSSAKCIMCKQPTAAADDILCLRYKK